MVRFHLQKIGDSDVFGPKIGSGPGRLEDDAVEIPPMLLFVENESKRIWVFPKIGVGPPNHPF